MGQDGADICQVAGLSWWNLCLFISIKGKSEKVWYTNWDSLYISYRPWQACLKHIQGWVWGLPIFL